MTKLQRHLHVIKGEFWICWIPLESEWIIYIPLYSRIIYGRIGMTMILIQASHFCGVNVVPKELCESTLINDTYEFV